MDATIGAAEREFVGVVASAAAGDDLAFARIVSAFHDDMLRVCAFVAGDESVAEDAVQVAWSIAWRKLDSLRHPERLRPWLMRIAVNETKRSMARSRRRRGIEVAAELAGLPASDDPAAGIDS